MVTENHHGQVETIAQRLNAGDYVVAFTGAGITTDSPVTSRDGRNERGRAQALVGILPAASRELPSLALPLRQRRRYSADVVAAIRQQVTVQPGGVIEIRSPELPPGARADVIVLLATPTSDATSRPAPNAPPAGPQSAGWRSYAGAFHGGDPTLSDNRRIDADLAREYDDPHEPSP